MLVLRQWRWCFLTGDTFCGLLRPLIGQSGSISLLISRVGPVGFAPGEDRKLTGVELRPDGLVLLERGTGWTVLDPAAVVAVVWHGEAEGSQGQFL
jgi:hypothetical protein